MLGANGRSSSTPSWAGRVWIVRKRWNRPSSIRFAAMPASRRGWMLPATTSDQFGHEDVAALDAVDPLRPAVVGLEHERPRGGAAVIAVAAEAAEEGHQLVVDQRQLRRVARRAFRISDMALDGGVVGHDAAGTVGSGSLRLSPSWLLSCRAFHWACSAPCLVQLGVPLLERPEGRMDHLGAAGTDVLDHADPEPRLLGVVVVLLRLDRERCRRSRSSRRRGRGPRAGTGRRSAARPRP